MVSPMYTRLVGVHVFALDLPQSVSTLLLSLFSSHPINAHRTKQKT